MQTMSDFGIALSNSIKGNQAGLRLGSITLLCVILRNKDVEFVSLCSLSCILGHGNRINK